MKRLESVQRKVFESSLSLIFCLLDSLLTVPHRRSEAGIYWVAVWKGVDQIQPQLE